MNAIVIVITALLPLIIPGLASGIFKYFHLLVS